MSSQENETQKSPIFHTEAKIHKNFISDSEYFLEDLRHRELIRPAAKLFGDGRQYSVLELPWEKSPYQGEWIERQHFVVWQKFILVALTYADKIKSGDYIWATNLESSDYSHRRRLFISDNGSIVGLLKEYNIRGIFYWFWLIE